MKFSKIIRGVEVDIEAHNYEYSPDINVVGYEYVTATDMDGNPFDLTDDEQEQLTIEASQAKEDEPMYFEGDGWETDYD